MDLPRGVLLGIILISACGDSPPGRTYYERNIEPILQQKCAGNTSGCHSINADDPYAFAAGNLDVTTFENLQRRRDLLTPFGAYQYPLLLIKAVAPAMAGTSGASDPNKLSVQYRDQFLPLDVLHAGGSIIEVSSDAYFTLQTWLENGATRNGLKPPTPARAGAGDCSPAVPAGFDASRYTSDPNFASFKSNVQPVLEDKGCSAGNCHGAPQSDFYITCGSSEEQLAFNFSQAWSFVNDPVDDSQLLRVPLAVAAGGRGHTGGDQFADANDGEFVAIRTWATAVGKLDFADTTEKAFFEDHVQPVILQRGCAFEACHSPAATNDFKLRSGAQGFFSAVALEKNYELLKSEFMAAEFPDVRRGRAVAKVILGDDYRLANQVGGIAHRGGAILETPGTTTGSDPALCPTWTGTTPPANVTPFCVVQEWISRERAAISGQVTPMNSGSTVDVVFVDRPTGQAADRLQFSTFQGGADLVRATATFGGNFGRDLSITGTPESLLASCAGLTAGSADIQAPDVANDGDRVAFAARGSSGAPLSVYVVRLSNGACTQVTAPSGMIHNFDPAWSPDGQWLVFASTRGKSGPTESRKRPLPQSDLWRVRVDAAGAAMGTPEQMTFLTNSELGPQFMREGRITMTTEKAASDGGGFYQLAGRRINWDLTDYHPLLAQRARSPFPTLTDLVMQGPSVGYSSATDIREASDGNFLLILSDVDVASGNPALPAGGGALAIFNRSVGPFEQGRADPGYLPSMKIIDGASSTGRAGSAGIYRAPSTLPDGQILASFGQTASLAWSLVAVNPRTGTRTTLLAPPGGRAYVDAVLAYKYPARTLYSNRRQLVFGGTVDASDPGHAVVHFPDAPMAFTLLTGNLRRGRPVDAFRSARYLVVEEEKPCGVPCSRGSGLFENRTMLGRAELADDGSARIRVPAGVGVVLSLQDGNGATLVKMSEEHQLGPGEMISLGIRQSITNSAGNEVRLFDAVCAGCHGSVSGRELDVLVSPDALTGASVSLSQNAPPTTIGP